MTDTEFRPDTIVVSDEDLRQLRGLAEVIGVKRGRVYGLAFEYAVAHGDEFTEYARENLQSTSEGAETGEGAGGTQQPPHNNGST